MSTVVGGTPQGGDELAGMEDGALTLNPEMAAQEGVKDEQPPAEAEPEAEAPEGEEAASEDTPEGEEKPKRNKVPRDERIKQLTGEKKDLLRQIEELKTGNLQSQIDEIKKLLTPPENTGNIPDNRDVEPDPTDLTKYRLGDLDPAYNRDMARWEARQEIRNELAADRQRQADREAQAQRERHASEVLGKISDIADKGTALQPDFVETVVAPFMQGRLPLEEATFEASAESPHGAEILRELALNPSEAIRVASLTPFQQIKYVSDKTAEFAAKSKPRLPQAGVPPQNIARGTGGRFGIRGDEDDLSAIEKAIYGRG